MTREIRHLLTLHDMKPFSILICMLFTFGGALLGADEDGEVARKKFGLEANAKFQASDWAWLEKTAHDLRSTKARFPDGLWKLRSLYSAFDLQVYAKSEKDREEFLRKFAAWKTAYPQSVTQRVAEARALIAWAWKARGGDWAQNVTEQGWTDFRARLAQARTVLEGAEKLSEKCPQWFSEMQMVALGQQWKRSEYDRLCKRAVAFEPTYYDFYFDRANYLLPRWNGREGEWLKDAERAAREDDPAEGMTVYTRMVWSQTSGATNPFDGGASWEKMKRGFLDIQRAYPDSTWNLNTFCRFAVLARDRNTARELFTRIGTEPNLAAWDNTRGKFEAARKWATAPAGAGDAKPRATFTAANDAPMRCVAFSPDGKLLATGDRYGAVTVWSVATGKPMWRPGSADTEASSVAFSPDGKLLAVAWGTSGSKSEKKGKAVVFDVASHTERAQIAGWKQGALAVKFTRDGRALVMTGGAFNEIGEVQVWESATGKVTREEWTPPRKHSLESLALSPDGSVMATPCARSIDVYDLKAKKFLLPGTEVLKRRIYGVDFSPDGRLLATATGHNWNQRDKPGAIVLWDVPTWKPRARELPTPNGMGTVAFAPDGRWIVGGGQDGIVRVWDVATGVEKSALLGHSGMVWEVAVSPDGRTIASASEDGKVLLWDATGSH